MAKGKKINNSTTSMKVVADENKEGRLASKAEVIETDDVTEEVADEEVVTSDAKAEGKNEAEVVIEMAKNLAETTKDLKESPKIEVKPKRKVRYYEDVYGCNWNGQCFDY